jgi:hypothetical protein
MTSQDDLIIWPDDTWCLRQDLHQYGWKSDDYLTIPEWRWVYPEALNLCTSGLDSALYTALNALLAAEEQALKDYEQALEEDYSGYGLEFPEPEIPEPDCSGIEASVPTPAGWDTLTNLR